MSGSRTRRLLKNTVLYSAANIGAKFLSFVVVPLYTHYLAPASMGRLDLILTTLALLQPLVLLQLSDALLRWLLDDEQDRSRVISTALLLVTVSTALAGAIYGLAWAVFRFDEALVMFGIFAADALGLMLQQVARGERRNLAYALSGLLSTAAFLALAVWYVVVRGEGLHGMLLARMWSSVVTLIVLAVVEWRTLASSVRTIDRGLSAAMLKFSMPLIPTTMNWWAMESLSRYAILISLGPYYNGLFALATKFSWGLYGLTSLFYMAWQESAISEHHSEDRGAFFALVLRRYYMLLIGGTAVLVPATRLVIVHLLDPRYAPAWRYTSLLYLGAVFNALATFWGVGYYGSRRTSGAFYTTLIGSVANLVLVMILIRYMGLHAAAVANCAGYAVLFVARVRSMRRYFAIPYSVARLTGMLAYLCLVMAVSYFTGDLAQWALVVLTLGIAAAIALPDLKLLLSRARAGRRVIEACPTER